MRASAWRLLLALLGSAILTTIPQPARAQLLNPPAAETNANPAAGSNNELQALRKQLKETQDRLHAFEADDEALRRRNDLNKQTIHTLNESLSVAIAEREVFQRQYGELKLRMEALGLASVGDNKGALEQRLLKAVRDLSLVRDEKDKLVERIEALSESVILCMKTATVTDPQIRLDVEAQLRAANEAIKEAADQEAVAAVPPPVELSNGQVISVKEEYSLVVGNFGSQQGVKVGMPFLIVRGDHLVAKARVIDVRERICGAVIEEYGSNTEKAKVGDRLRVDVQL